MIKEIIDVVRRVVDNRQLGDVLELGSMNVNGTIRDALVNFTTYTGIDISPGPCVDLIIDKVEDLPQQLFDTVVCCETLEHVVNPWKTLEYLKTRLKKGGLLIVSTPTYGFPEHRFPIDCYRFGEDAYKLFIFEDFEIIHMSTVNDYLGYPIIVGVGIK